MVFVSGPCVYLLVVREFKRLREPVIKAGRTDNLRNRLDQYPGGTILLAAAPVFNAVATERALMKAFAREFRTRLDVGKEYFEVLAPFPAVAPVAMKLFYETVIAMPPEHGARMEDAITGGGEEEEEEEEGARLGGAPREQPSGDEEEDAEEEGGARLGGTSWRPSEPSGDEEEGGGDAPPRLREGADLFESTLSFIAEHAEELEGRQVPTGELFDRFHAWLQRRSPPGSKIIQNASLTRFVQVLRSRFKATDESAGMIPMMRFPAAAAVEPRETEPAAEPLTAMDKRMVEWVERTLDFAPVRTEAEKGKKLFAFVGKKELVERMWKEHKESATQQKEKKGVYTLLLLRAMEIKGRTCRTLFPTTEYGKSARLEGFERVRFLCDSFRERSRDSPGCAP